MRYELSCKDLGMRDNFVIIGENKKDIVQKMVAHMKREHHMIDSQINTLKMKKFFAKSIHPCILFS